MRPILKAEFPRALYPNCWMLQTFAVEQVLAKGVKVGDKIRVKLKLGKKRKFFNAYLMSEYDAYAERGDKPIFYYAQK